MEYQKIFRRFIGSMIKNEQNTAKHSLILESREKMTLSGVNEVCAFSDTAVVLKTNMGDLTLRGKNLNIGKLNTETGELFISGEFNSLQYSKSKNKGSVFEGLLR